MSLNKNNSIVEEALLQMKSIEEAISENAKGILASTMKEEISELVRESLNGPRKKYLYEQPEQGDEMAPEGEIDVEDTEDGTEETEVDAEVDMDGEEIDFSAMDAEVPMDNEDEMPPLDMTGSSPEEVLKVWKAMGDEDGIIIKKDGDYVHLTDSNTNNDYMISLGGESNNIEAMPMDTANESVIYELVFEEDEKNSEMYEDEDEDEMYEMYKGEDEDEMYEMYEDEDEDEMYEMYEDEDEDEVVYELEVQESMKPVGIGFGRMSSGFKKSSVNNKGFKDNMKGGSKSEKTGRGPKFSFGKIKHGVTESEMYEDNYDDEEFDVDLGDEEFYEMHNMHKNDDEEFYEGFDDESHEGDYMDDDMSTYDEMPGETTEASRTLGNGSRNYPGRGLPKMKVRPTNEGVSKEMNLLREKNEEYKKALDFFRNKLNEVAVFNSNLAYSTRLFTEHSTTKQEKINILRRFDNAESIKESKSLYKTIKNELDGSKGSNEIVTESIQRQVSKAPSNGSASNLIESKTYENPQFMRMRDLMSKM